MRHLLCHLATVPLGDIDATAIRNLYIVLARDGVGQPSIAKAAIILKQILRQAVNDDILLRNPCERVEAPTVPTAKRGTTRDGRAEST